MFELLYVYNYSIGFGIRQRGSELEINCARGSQMGIRRKKMLNGAQVYQQDGVTPVYYGESFKEGTGTGVRWLKKVICDDNIGTYRIYRCD